MLKTSTASGSVTPIWESSRDLRIVRCGPVIIVLKLLVNGSVTML